ncbi:MULTISPECIES: C45 family autoproteolytic acyltransferase/hydolase [Microbacterium]|uniref:C45 family autoproteolytic acyltransferase/hydolase n=1 Tax=Microbacterium TaxID=33882 RepID=UPI00217E63A1|nr:MULTISPECIES: C45 family peptidase [Microbacterium]UWF77268.1 peptidase C45 [Microbacterium neungamense]WCM55425.1 peptidase C45 [Microbacterium sp. EF45047]
MQLRFSVSTAPDAAARGRELGAEFAPQFRESVRLYLEHFEELGIADATVQAITERSHDALRAWAPGLAAETEAIAEASGIELWQLAAVGARTEVLAVAPTRSAAECSTAVRTGPGIAPETFQTWDWHEFLVPEGLMRSFTSDAGLHVKLFTEFGTAAKIGVNDAGVGLHFNILMHSSDSDAGGVPVHAVARRILDEARSLDDAIRIAGSATVSASTVLTVFESTAEGSQAASIELSPAAMAIVRPAEDGWLFHTNHFLDPELATGDTMPDASETRERYEHLDRVRGTLADLAPTERAAAACGGEGEGAVICIRPDDALPRPDQWQTLLTISVDAAGFGLDFFPGSPAEAAEAGMSRL